MNSKEKPPKAGKADEKNSEADTKQQNTSLPSHKRNFNASDQV